MATINAMDAIKQLFCRRNFILEKKIALFCYLFDLQDSFSAKAKSNILPSLFAFHSTCRPSRHYPFFGITAPPEFAGKEPTEVLRQLDWTSESQRNRYQDVLLEENTHMTQVCVSSETGGYALVS